MSQWIGLQSSMSTPIDVEPPASAVAFAASDESRWNIEARPMLDLYLLISASEVLLRDLQALTPHATPVLALTSSLTQIAWLQLRSRGPSGRRWTVAQLVRIGLCGVIFAALPPGSRLVVSLLGRAARSTMISKLYVRSLNSTALAPTSRLAFGKHEP